MRVISISDHHACSKGGPNVHEQPSCFGSRISVLTLKILRNGSRGARLHREVKLFSGRGSLGRTTQAIHASMCSDDASGADTRPPLLVTASVDRIALARRLSIAEDLSMTGQVVWTGRSSMDIRMQLTQASLNPNSCAWKPRHAGQYVCPIP